MRFIHAADIHLDSPLRGLDRYQGAPVERLRTATRQAFTRLIDLAIAEKVDLVLLAGDIYDRDWQDFHTGLYFREQMVRLDRSGIRAYIVQGNHDAEGVIQRQLILPANVTVFSSRKAGTFPIEAVGVAIHGRSFPERKVTEDWVPTYPDPVPGMFNIGMLHTSLDGRPGHDRYAPTDAATLIAKGYDYWALGHVHAREVVAEAPRIVFPGNLQGRHANETGAKGCELVSVTAGRIEAEFVPLDVVRWAQVTVALDAVDGLAAMHEKVHAQLETITRSAPDRLHAVRITLSGASSLRQLEAKTPGTLAAAVQAAAQDIHAADLWIEQVRVELSLPFNRADAARRDDAVGELVRLVDAIANDEAQLKALAQSELGVLLSALPAEVGQDDMPSLDDMTSLRALLADAETTVLARLATDG